MNLLKSPLRRTTAAIGGALIGLTGALVFASPAGAHHPIVSVGTRCASADGSWQVTWHVLNSERDVPGKIRELVSDPNVAIDGFAVGTEFPVRSGGVIKGTQKFEAGVESATLMLKGEWVRDGQVIVNDGFHPEAIGRVSKPKKKCDEPPASPSPSPSSPSPSPSESPSASPSVSPSASPSTPTSPSPSPSVPAEEPGIPQPIIDGDCTSMTIGMDNPADGMPLTLTFETSKGEKRTLEIAPGEKKTEKFSATEGFTVKITLTIDGESASETVEFQKPDDCDAGSGGGELPLTGAAAGSIAGGAGALLALGGVLFFLARRRKVKFTA